jgi:hypothetical protein
VIDFPLLTLSASVCVCVRVLSPGPILDALVLDMKKEKPFKIQASTLPYILQGRNIIAQAQAGAGKTIAFAIGILARVDSAVGKLQAICLTPTRVSKRVHEQQHNHNFLPFLPLLCALCLSFCATSIGACSSDPNRCTGQAETAYGAAGAHGVPSCGAADRAQQQVR